MKYFRISLYILLVFCISLTELSAQEDITDPTVTGIDWNDDDFGSDDIYHINNPVAEATEDLTVKITFSENVTGFTTDDITLSGASIAKKKSLSGSNAVYTLTFTLTVPDSNNGTGDGTLGFTIAANAVEDNAGRYNAEYTSGDDSATVWLRPVLTIEVPTGDQKGPFDITYSYNESMTGMTPGEYKTWVTGHLTLAADSARALASIGGSVESVTISEDNKDYAVRIVPTKDGTFPTYRIGIHDIRLKNVNDVNVTNNLYSEETVTVSLPAVAEIEWKDASVIDEKSVLKVIPVLAWSFSARITFNKAVTGFEAADIMRSGTAGHISLVRFTEVQNGDGKIYNLGFLQDLGANNYPGDGSQDGTLIITIPADVVDNSGGNTAHTAEMTLQFYPWLEIVQPETPQNGPFDIRFKFNETVGPYADDNVDVGGLTEEWLTELLEDSLTPIGATITSFSSNSDGSEYTATITPTTDGTFQEVEIAVVPARNAHGLGYPVPITIEDVTVDLTAPTVTLSDSLGGNVQTDEFDVTITFSEAVTEFQADDIDLSGTATTETPELTGSGTTYTATITPTTDGTVIVNIPADVAEDTATNGNTASNSLTINVDVLPPTVNIDVPTESVGATFNATITFSEPVTGFQPDDINLSGTATATATLPESDTTYTATYTATITSTTGGTVIINIPANVAQDATNKGNTATTSETVEVDLLRPTVVVSEVPHSATGEFDVTITFNEPVTGFDASDIVLSATASATVVPPQTSGVYSSVYTATITFPANFTDDLTFSIRENGAQDSVGNGNTASDPHTVRVGIIADPNLRIAIRRALGLAENVAISESNIVNLFELNPVELGIDVQDPTLKIRDLSGTEYAIELTNLYLDSNAISNIRLLETLTQLTALSLKNNIIEGILYVNSAENTINPLLGLTELTALYLDDNLISDVTPFEPLTQLTRLSLSGNLITDISLLETLTSLTELGLDRTLITDISPLAALTQLEVLSLNRNQISDFSTLGSLTGLRELYLNENDLEDISWIASLPALEVLHLVDNDISDVSALAGLRNLKELNLTGNPIADTTPLIGVARAIEIDSSVGSVPPLVADEALRDALRDSFDLDSDARIVYADMQSLTTLEAPDTDIVSLDGLEHASLLETLDLRGNAITDLTPLEGLTGLTTLDLGVNQIIDITVLSGLTQLMELYLEDNEISDVSALASLVNLETLRLTGNSIMDASPLAGFSTTLDVDISIPDTIADPNLAAVIRETLNIASDTRLTPQHLANLITIDVQAPEVSTLTGLEYATALTELNIANATVSDLASLKALTELTTLGLNGGSVTDLTPLAGLVALTTLRLSNNAIESVNPLAALTELTSIDLSGNAITAIATIESLTGVTDLNLNDNDITSIDGLESLTALRTLDLGDNSLTDITALENLTRLTRLNLNGNSLENITPLEDLIALTALALNGNSITEINALDSLTALAVLELSDNSVSSLAPLTSLTTLTTLALSGNGISDISSLANMTMLTTLDLGENSISSITPLQLLTGLTTLDLSANSLTDIESLQGLTALTRLYLNGNNISDVTRLAGLTNLELLRLAGNPVLDTSPLYVLVTSHNLTDVDIQIAQYPPWDVNQDGIVDISDAVLVATAMGQTGQDIVNPLTDVNGDSRVDGDDLLLIGSHLTNMDASMAAPSKAAILAVAGVRTFEVLNRDVLNAERTRLIVESDGSLKYQRTIDFLEGLLRSLHPQTTRLLANYPNPFNPETWIPYELATGGDVALTIYDVHGRVVRRLALGYQPPGYYTYKHRAAYWDGRNAIGEQVASGIYFYELQTDKSSFLRKMVILK